MGNSSPQIASREHTPFPPDRAGGRVGCPNTRGNLRKYGDSCVSDKPQRFSTSLLEEALTPENRSPTVRPALRWTRGWKHSRRETGPPQHTLRPIAPGNGSGSSPPWDLDRSGGLFLRGGRGGIGGRRVWAYSGSMAPSPPTAAPEKILRWIMVAVLVWGSTLAAGSWTFNHDIRRPIIVFACVVGFLGFWNVMLAARSRRLARGDAREGRG